VDRGGDVDKVFVVVDMLRKVKMKGDIWFFLVGGGEVGRMKIG
jgi:hypothetical protein